jgi:hypothetical protein
MPRLPQISNSLQKKAEEMDEYIETSEETRVSRDGRRNSLADRPQGYASGRAGRERKMKFSNSFQKLLFGFDRRKKICELESA